ncbi:SURF1 family protein [Parasphingorhabdus halotolerans]|uniref:SURF1-like protein n=1 Tax=Parasphingorhabdus halotolerans TaxID=2725558 RepID=A0A6H2DQ86_9SPHN|nr:SURF1 family protein [Parasphingorhabdus halotolerans]QJB70297.1 SURF1 family protein [Parasphingorhabdus halotolerans]
MTPTLHKAGRNPARKKAPWLALITLCFVLLCGLGIWQVERLQWKEALIARVDARVHRAPAQAPGPSAWAGITADNSEYLPVTASGRFLPVQPVLAKAVTAYGSGFWVISPLATDQGFTVLINRGFIADSAAKGAAANGSIANGSTGGLAAPPPGPQTITGPLRISEPRGGFLRSNDPTSGRWFSRDVAAIAKAQRLTGAAPYFIDAAAGSEPAAGPPPPGRAGNASASARTVPIGGLTVIAFPNNHLIYAITWFTLALMAAYAGLRLFRDGKAPYKKSWL